MISVSLGLTWYTILWYIIECGGILGFSMLRV